MTRRPPTETERRLGRKIIAAALTAPSGTVSAAGLSAVLQRWLTERGLSLSGGYWTVADKGKAKKAVGRATSPDRTKDG